MGDPYVFGPEVSDDGRAAAAGFLEDEARALSRAYHAHGDQLAALEAEAAADRHRAEGRRLTAGGWLRGILGLGLGPYDLGPP